jgi:plasmid stabilization system protein ParE
MKYELEYLPLAQQDMVDIVTYISKDLCNPIAADKLAHKFIDEAEKIRDFPYSMPAYYPIRELGHDYRKLLVDNYIMFYWVDETRHCVTVARVIYAKSDYSKRLK